MSGHEGMSENIKQYTNARSEAGICVLFTLEFWLKYG
jgi:hypothetical protein